MDTEELLRLLREHNVDFETVWSGKVESEFGSTKVYFASLDDLIRMKKQRGELKIWKT